MRFNSIRWQLPLSYAAIALVAALALGGVLLSILKDYYGRVELAYVVKNALTIRDYLEDSSALHGPPAALEGQIEAFAFLTRARIVLTDPQGEQLVDTGRPEDQLIELGGLPRPDQPSTMTLSTVDITVTRTITTEQNRLLIRTFPGGIQLDSSAPDLRGGLPDVPQRRELMWFNSGIPDDPGARSDQQAQVAVTGAGGNVLGYVALSEGPAYGREILRSVARGWALASGFAVLLASVAGWLVSRRISQPVLALAGATERMAHGDLAARAPPARRVRELDVLASSFNEMAEGIEGTLLTLRRFVSDAAHQLHTPLTALRTDLELAIGAETDERQHERLRRAQGQAERLQALADELLELSRVEAGAGRPPEAVVDLAQLVHEATAAQASRAEQAGLYLRVEVPDTPLRLLGRAAELGSLVDNLLDNALKFTPTGGSVSVTLHEESGRALLTVSDTGIGIAAEDVSAIFSRFHRGHNATSYPGSGLGLAIVKAVAEAHSGSVSVAPGPPGATLTVMLPLLGRRGGSGAPQ